MISRAAIALAFLTLIPTLVFAQNGSHVPTVDELMTLETVGAPHISPDGKGVAYIVTGTDFSNDAYPSQVWIANTATGERFKLTSGAKSSSMPRWSPDGKWLAFLSDRNGDKNQIFVIRPFGGEAQALTKHETAITEYDWSADSKSIAFLSTEPVPQSRKDRDDRYSKYEVIRHDYNFVHIWTLDVADAMKNPVSGRQRTSGDAFSVNSFSWSPDSARIAFAGTINPDLAQAGTSDIYVLSVDDNAVRKVVSMPGPDTNPQWSPDGRSLVFNSVLGDTIFGVDRRLAIVAADGKGIPRSITRDFDEDPTLVAWKPEGIYFAAAQKTASHLFFVDPKESKVTRISAPDNFMGNAFSFTADGQAIAFIASSEATLNEVFVSSVHSFSPRPLTQTSTQIKDWKLGKREIISWKSQDGATIEGVLIKPANFDPSRKYPLLCIIHGGPNAVDRPGLLSGDTRYYPADIWAARGALVLKVNYRGSTGYGEAFRRLAIKNLGIGDSWDVISGVDYLISKGWVDAKKVACMGWSEGGYISAFLTTSSNRFAAISVGAGISDWSTYYYSTDIPNFTLDYLGANPLNDPDIYKKTSPITYINDAKTPTLIQHGELDKRVPIANSYELRQALEDRGVPVEMIVYKGFGHGINKPKSMRAVMEHNLGWFNHYIWGDPVPDFSHPNLLPGSLAKAGGNKSHSRQ